MAHFAKFPNFKTLARPLLPHFSSNCGGGGGDGVGTVVWANRQIFKNWLQFEICVKTGPDETDITLG